MSTPEKTRLMSAAADYGVAVASRILPDFTEVVMCVQTDDAYVSIDPYGDIHFDADLYSYLIAYNDAGEHLIFRIENDQHAPRALGQLLIDTLTPVGLGTSDAEGYLALAFPRTAVTDVDRPLLTRAELGLRARPFLVPVDDNGITNAVSGAVNAVRYATLENARRVALAKERKKKHTKSRKRGTSPRR